MNQSPPVDSDALCRTLAVSLAGALPAEPLKEPVRIIVRVRVKAIVEKWLGRDPAAYGADDWTRLREAAERLDDLALAESPRSILFPCRLKSASSWEADGEIEFFVIAGHPLFRPGIDENDLDLVK